MKREAGTQCSKPTMCRTDTYLGVEQKGGSELTTDIMRSARGRRRGLASSQESGRRGSRW